MDITVTNKVTLDEMPFDKWDVAINGFVHATGYLLILSNGDEVVEYEDDIRNVGDIWGIVDEIIEE